MPRTFDSPSIAASLSDGKVQKERSGMVLQFRNTPEQVERLAQRKEENTYYEQERDHLRSEMIFLAHRRFAAPQAMDRIHALELKAIEDFPLERILEATDPEENQSLYDELCQIENSYINQLITQDYDPDADFVDQRGLARINLIKFYLSKADLCCPKGIKLKDINLDDHILKDTELRLNDIQKQIRKLFNEAREIGRTEPDTFQSFSDNIAALTSDSAEPKVSIPEKAPELYAKRPDKSEKPETFLERAYEGLTGTAARPASIFRSHIKAWDPQLYDALYKRRKIIKNFEILLPKSQGKSVADLNLTDTELVNRARQKNADRQRQFRHKQ
ncbi:MAG: hypothetical protein ABJT31_12980 [Hyphomicrobiales bacterium]